MFENIIEQNAAFQLKEDILYGRLAPSVLFYGPGDSGKSSAAIELARVLSCLEKGDWNCSCVSCGQFRYLQNSDLLIMGERPFNAEIAACSSVLLKNHSFKNSKTLFYRACKKLMIRFSPVLIEDDTRLISKVSSVLQSLEDNLNELFLADTSIMERAKLEKLCASIVKNANTLVKDGFGSTIPIAQIRKASFWCRLAPVGKRKILIIENAETMREEARNSLLKLLEEPPNNVNIVLTAQRKEAIMPTILSRLRPYRFLKRSEKAEKEILRRVFQVSDDTGADGLKSISSFLDSFNVSGDDKLLPLAAWFIGSFSRICAVSYKRKGMEIPEFFIKLGETLSKMPLILSMEKPERIENLIKILHEKSSNFENDSFSRFLKICLELISQTVRTDNNPYFIKYIDIFSKYFKETDTVVNLLNQNSVLAMERLLYKLKTSALVSIPEGIYD